MRKVPICILFIGLSISCRNDSDSQKMDTNGKIQIEKATAQIKYLSQYIVHANGKLKFPRTIDTAGKLKLVGKKDWTSGFYPGVLWLMYDLSGDSSWYKKATKYTDLLESEKFNNSSHDLGFKMMCSFGLGYRHTKNEKYKEVLLQSAKTLITRFDEKVGCIRSWDHHQDKWEFPVIIDNLMNLELLYWAWKETGDSVFFNIANKHAKTTIKNHFRNDYSTYHVVNYDPVSGLPTFYGTHQGFDDESCWSRGQAWALYGYTMAYRETKDPEFLRQAENIANYIINIAQLPSDLIPTWDFNLTDIRNEPKDASSAAIMASALFELSTLAKNSSENYLKVANDIMNALSSKEYFNSHGANNGFLLKHSTGSRPHNSEVDVPLIYADYYYLEALSRSIKINRRTQTL